MTSVLLIGKESFLGQGLVSLAHSHLQLTAVGHDVPLESLDFDVFDVVVNMAYAPYLRDGPYEEALDKDLALARSLMGRRTHYVMVSSRKVYGPQAPFPVDEDTPCAPADHYGRNKLTSERVVCSLLGARATILRLGNIFGFEPGRRTFFGQALTRLKAEGRIVLDVAPTIRRDFLAREDFASLLANVLIRRPAGLFNLGSGAASAVGDIAQWLIQGYGRGQLVVESMRQYDSFELDCTKLRRLAGVAWPDNHIQRRCVEIGRQLASA